MGDVIVGEIDTIWQYVLCHDDGGGGLPSVACHHHAAWAGKMCVPRYGRCSVVLLTYDRFFIVLNCDQ